MKIFDSLKGMNQSFKKNIFRREVETAHFSGKEYKLPEYPVIAKQEVSKYKDNFPLNFYSSRDEYTESREVLKNLISNEDLLRQADNILNNKIRLFGDKEVELGAKINWNYDYNAEYGWNVNLAWREDYFNFPKGVDIKVPWQISRFYQMLTLGKAYLLTGDEKYTSKFLELFTEFETSNPFCSGVNWVDVKEVSIRMLNFIFSLPLFLPSDLVNEEHINSFIKFILRHSIYIENNFEFSLLRSHEYLTCLLSLSCAGLVLQETFYGNKNLKAAYQGFEQEIRRQINKDGTTHTQSVAFHSISLEAFYLARVILSKGNYILSEDYNLLLHKMFTAQSAYLRKDGSIPQIGDTPSGRIVDFNSSGLMYDHFMAIGAYLFKDPELKCFKQQPLPELLLLFGKNGIEGYNNVKALPPSLISMSFPNSGYYILNSKDASIFVKAGDLGSKDLQTTGHNDTFSFELFFKNKLFIVDSGTYSYYADKQLRNQFRSVKHHNTIHIDNEELCDFIDIFRRKDDLTKPKLLEWHTNESEDNLSVQHFAYTWFTNPIICKRTFNFLKDKGILKIKDEFMGGGKHQANGCLFFHPAVKLYQIDGRDIVARYGIIEIHLNFQSPSDYFSITISDTEYSKGYGIIEPSKKINIILKDQFPAVINTQIKLMNK